MAVVMVVAGFLFSAVASYMAGLVGSSNNPVSGITISTILVVRAAAARPRASKRPAGPVAAILIGGVVCCAAAIGGDNLQDLKCGQLVGSTPWKQQVMQILGVVVAALVMAPVLNLLNDAYGIGSNGLPAPQANLMGTVAKGVFAGGLPWTIIGDRRRRSRSVVIVIDSVLEARRLEDPHPGDGVRGRRLPAVRPERPDLPRRRDRLPRRALPRSRRRPSPSAAARSSAWACSPLPASSQARR